MKHAPIALFVYNRPWHTRQTIDALLANTHAAESELYIFSDAPKNEAAASAVESVRAIVRGVSGFKSVTVIEREINFGLARSVIDGVTMLCERYGRAIAVEDDLVTSPFFLEYMNTALDLYADEPRVMQISGYMFPIDRDGLGETFFLGVTSTWGWGVWKRSWKYFDQSGSRFQELKIDSAKRRRFDLEGSVPYFKMFKKQLKGWIDSWGILWYASVFCQGGVCLFPTQSLVRNIGHDDSGVHSGKTNIFEVDLIFKEVGAYPRDIAEDILARERLVKFYRGNRRTFVQLAVRAFRKIFILKRGFKARG